MRGPCTTEAEPALLGRPGDSCPAGTRWAARGFWGSLPHAAGAIVAVTPFASDLWLLSPDQARSGTTAVGAPRGPAVPLRGSSSRAPCGAPCSPPPLTGEGSASPPPTPQSPRRAGWHSSTQRRASGSAWAQRALQVPAGPPVFQLPWGTSWIGGWKRWNLRL